MSRWDDTRAVVSRFVEAVSKGDRSGLDALLSPDAEWWVLGKGHLVRATFMTVIPADRPEPLSARRTFLSIVVEEDRAALEIEIEVRWADRTYRNRCHHLIVVDGSHIVSFREYLDPTASQGFFDTTEVIPVGADPVT